MEITSLELILKLLQDGKITVSEAMRLIQDIQNESNITYVPIYPNIPYTPINPYYQVWCGDNTIATSGCGNDTTTTSGNDGVGVAHTGSSSVGFSSNYSCAKC